MILKFEDIEWDCDEEASNESLPCEWFAEVDDDFDVDGDAVDLLSDEFGWLVKGCMVRRFKEVE